MKKKFFLSVLVFIFISSPGANAQLSVQDSLVQWLQAYPQPDTNRVKNLVILSTRLYRGYPDSARRYAKEGLALAQDLNYLSGEATALRLIGYTHGVQGRSDSALYHFELALELFKQLGDDRNIASINAAMATDYARNDDFEKAINGFLEASVFFNKIGNVQAEGVMYSNIGNVFLEQGLLIRAKEYYQKASNTLSKITTTNRNLSLVFTNLSMVSNRLQSYEDAISYADQAIEIGLINEQFATLTSPYISKGRALKTLGRIEEALTSFKEAEKYNQIRGSLKTKAEIQFDIATIHYQLGNHSEAKSYIDDVIDDIKMHDLTLYETLPNALILSTKIEQKLGNSGLGINRALEAINIEDSLHNEEMALRISELETIYETEKKEAQIQLLEIENEVANLRILVISILGSITLILVIFSFWWYHKTKAEQRKRKMEGMKSELQKFGLVISEKNNFISRFKEELDEVRRHVRTLEGRKELTSLVDSIHQNINLTEDENELFSKIDHVNAGFYMELRQRSESLTEKDERLATLIQMDLTTKDIANILHIEPGSVKRAKNRLKKKLQLNGETDLGEYLRSLAA